MVIWRERGYPVRKVGPWTDNQPSCWTSFPWKNGYTPYFNSMNLKQTFVLSVWFWDPDYNLLLTLLVLSLSPFLPFCHEQLVPPEEYERWLQRGLSVAESRCEGSYHCATPDCPGWCVYEDTVNVFHCPVCKKHNCLICKVLNIYSIYTEITQYLIIYSCSFKEILSGWEHMTRYI